MCEANAYLVKDGTEELVLEAVDTVEPQEDGEFRLVDIFGGQKVIRGRLREMKLVDHRIVFEA
ncbi:MAG: CooT family nickel-binding protein [Desulfobacterales bacterium]|jgi:predicted RNA-binding protein